MMAGEGHARPLVVAFTGHRRLDDEERVADAIRAELTELAARSDAGVILICGLAEGADRLAAREVLRLPGGRMRAILPVAAEDYERDFVSTSSREEFRRLLALAAPVEIAPEQPDRAASYFAAGCLAVDACDIVVAVWDGRPGRGSGGTADVVAYARRRAKPLAIIASDDPARVGRERLPGDHQRSDSPPP